LTKGQSLNQWLLFFWFPENMLPIPPTKGTRKLHFPSIFLNFFQAEGGAAPSAWATSWKMISALKKATGGF